MRFELADPFDVADDQGGAPDEAGGTDPSTWGAWADVAFGIPGAAAAEGGAA